MLMKVGKGEGHSSPSPLSGWGQFPIFTGEPLSGTGRPHEHGPHEGAETFPPQAGLARRSPWVGQERKAHLAQVLSLQPPVVRDPFALELHAPETHAGVATGFNICAPLVLRKMRNCKTCAQG